MWRTWIEIFEEIKINIPIKIKIGRHAQNLTIKPRMRHGGWTKTWQLCTMCSKLTTAAWGLWFRVEHPTRYMPIASSQTWMGVNQCTYGRGWGKLPGCEGSVKMTQISAMHKPKYKITTVSEIFEEHLYISRTTQSTLLAMKVYVFDHKCSVKASRWRLLPRAIAAFWCRVNFFLALAIADVRFWREHKMNGFVDVVAIEFIR